MNAFLALLAVTGAWQVGDLDAKIQSVLPTAEEEAWLSIPWRVNLFQARKDSVEQGKPLFLWLMNGHPMGCT
jgi:hypothetical protein